MIELNTSVKAIVLMILIMGIILIAVHLLYYACVFIEGIKKKKIDLLLDEHNDKKEKH